MNLPDRRTPGHPASSALLLILVALLCSGATDLHAQKSCTRVGMCSPPEVRMGLDQELATAGLNALLGGVTVAVNQAFRGKPLWEGFWAGAAGGGAVYAGKRIAVEGFDGAGLLGRQVASVGGSVVRNAAAGRDPISEIVLSAGPVRVYLSRDRGTQARLDLATTIAAGSFIFLNDARLDFMQSLSSGALVFQGESVTAGVSNAGAFLLQPDLSDADRPRLLAHERVHVLQYDQAFLSWGESPDRWLADQLPFGGGLLDHVDVGAAIYALQLGLGLAMDYGDRPWEREAYFLSSVAHPLPATGTAPLPQQGSLDTARPSVPRPVLDRAAARTP